MASIMAHYLAAEKYNAKYDKYKGEDFLSFLVGSVAADAYKKGKARETSHFGPSPFLGFLDNVSFDLSGTALDFDLFYEKYGSRLNEPFIAGYLLHLCTDRKYFKEVITSLLDKYAPEIKEGAMTSKDLSFHEAMIWYRENLYLIYDIHDIEFLPNVNMNNVIAMSSFAISKNPIDEVDNDDLAHLLISFKEKCIRLQSEYLPEDVNSLISIGEMDSFLDRAIIESNSYIEGTKKITRK